MKIMVTAAGLLIAGAAFAHASQVTTVTSRQLVAAYEADQAVAPQKYGGVRLTVSGTVMAIVMNDTQDPVIVLAPGAHVYDVNANRATRVRKSLPRVKAQARKAMR